MRKILKISSFLFTTLVMCSCANKNSEEVNKVNTKLVAVDSLQSAFWSAWEKQDANALANMFTDNSTLFGGKMLITGKDSLMKKWVNVTLSGFSKVKITKIASDASSDMAYSSGFWVSDVVRNDSIIGVDEINYTLIWKKQSDNSWKMSMFFLGDRK